MADVIRRGAQAVKDLINRITGPGRAENLMTRAGRAAKVVGGGKADKAFPMLAKAQANIRRTARAAGGSRKNPKNLKALRGIQGGVGQLVGRKEQTRLVRGGLASSIVKRGAGGIAGAGG